MKTAVVWVAVLACLSGLSRAGAEGSAVPAGFAYQGVLSDPVTGPLAGEQTVTFRLFREASGGMPLWETNQVVTCSSEGLFHAWLEGGDGMVEAFTEQGDDPFGRYLELEVAGHGGAIAPRVEFTSAPQAFLARSARQAAAEFSVAGNLTVGADGGVQVQMADFARGAAFTNLEVDGDAQWTSNAAPLEVTGEVTAGGDLPGCFAPSGSIVMWTDMNHIPAGWVVCDGQNGTPDLRNRFPVGVKSNTSYSYAATGGLAKVVLTVDQMPLHYHQGTIAYPWQNTGISGGSAGDCFVDVTSIGGQLPDSTSPAGGGQPHENLPPYYALVYIMKL